MKKFRTYIFLFFCFLFAAGFSAAYSQDIFIVDMRGAVFVKMTSGDEWKKAKIDMALKQNSEVLTKKKSECTITFDEKLNNVITIKGDSHIKLKNVLPVQVELPKGRVFSIIEDIVSIKAFEISTPTAVAGVRGTGFSMGFINGITFINCFEDQVFVNGLDEQGSPTDEDTLKEGLGMDVGNDGALGQKDKNSKGENKEWNSFTDHISSQRDYMDQLAGNDNAISRQLREEERDGQKEETLEEIKRGLKQEKRDDSRGGQEIIVE